MRFRFVWGVSIKQLLNNLNSTCVVVLSLTACIASVFLMAEALLFSNDFLKDIEVNRRTYSIVAGAEQADSVNTYKVYEEVVHNNYLPEVSCINGIYANPILQENVEDYIGAAIYFESHPRYSVEFDLIDGRGFTEKEILEGTNVIVISNDLNYWKVGDEFQVGDEVLINDISYEIIGIDRHESYITEQNVIRNQNFYIYINEIQFAKALTPEEEQEFFQLFEMVGATPVSRFSQLISEFSMHVITYIMLIALVSYCAFSIIAQLFNFMVKSRSYEYNIYKVLGIQDSLLFVLYFMPIMLVFILSGIFGILIYRYSEPLQRYIGMGDVLPFRICIVCYVIVAGVLLLATMPNYLKLKHQSAIETR